MTPYLSLIFLIIVESFVYYFSKNKVKNKKNFMTIVCIELILFAGLRSTNIGVDTKNYLYALNYYRNMPIEAIFTTPNPWNIDYEIGYMILTKLLAFARFSDTQFLIVIACLIYIPVFIYIYEESDDVIFSLLFYMCFELFAYSLGIFRQMISVSILLLSIKHIKNRKFFKFILFVLLAMSFHYSAIVAIPLYFVFGKKFKKIYCLYLLVFEMIAIVFGAEIVGFIFEIVGKYSHYIGSKYGGSGGGYNLLLLHVLLIIGMVIFKNNNIQIKMKISSNSFIEATKNNDFHLFIISFAIILTLLAHTFSVIARANCFYIMLIISYTPTMIRKITTTQTRILMKIIGVILLIVYFYFSIVNEPRLNPFTFM